MLCSTLFSVESKKIAEALHDCKASAILSRYLWAVRPPPQDSKRNEEVRWEITARKSPIGSTNHQWGMKKPPLNGSFTLCNLNSLFSSLDAFLLLQLFRKLVPLLLQRTYHTNVYYRYEIDRKTPIYNLDKLLISPTVCL